jgi:hypothetical protein
MDRTKVLSRVSTSTLTRSCAVGGAVLAIVLGLSACGSVTEGGQEAAPSAVQTVEGPLIFGTGESKYPSDSIRDWVTYADFVAVVTPAAEREGDPDPDALKSGIYTVPRSVELSIESMVWESPEAQVQLPPSIDYSAMGRQVSLDERGQPTSSRLVAVGYPRLEIGHDYLMPIYWDDECVRLGPEWSSLGPIPFDGGVASVGEFEGTERTLDDAVKFADSSTDRESPLVVLAGLGEQEVSKLVNAAKPDSNPYHPPCE